MGIYAEFSDSPIYRFSNWERPYSKAESVCNGPYFPVAHVEGSRVFLALKKVIFGSRDKCLRAADAALSYLQRDFEWIESSHFAATTGFVYSLEINSEAANRSRETRALIDQGEKAKLVNFELNPVWKERFELSRRLNSELFATDHRAKSWPSSKSIAPNLSGFIPQTVRVPSLPSSTAWVTCGI